MKWPCGSMRSIIELLDCDSYLVLELTVDYCAVGVYSVHMIVNRTASFPRARVER